MFCRTGEGADELKDMRALEMRLDFLTDTYQLHQNYYYRRENSVLRRF